MDKGLFRRQNAKYAGPPQEVPELTEPVEFEVRITVPVEYRVWVKARSKKGACDADFHVGSPIKAELLNAEVEPRAESLWRGGTLLWERHLADLTPPSGKLRRCSNGRSKANCF